MHRNCLSRNQLHRRSNEKPHTQGREVKTPLPTSAALIQVLFAAGESKSYGQPALDSGMLTVARRICKAGTADIPHLPGLQATLHLSQGGCILAMEKTQLPLVVSALAVNPRGTNLWAWLLKSHRFYLNYFPAYHAAHSLHMPKTFPWMGTVDAPGISDHVAPPAAGRLREVSAQLGLAIVSGRVK